VHVAHEELEGPGLPELLVEHYIELLLAKGVAEGRLDEAVADELLQSSEDGVVGHLGYGFSAFEIGVALDNLAEEEVESILGEGGVHEGLVVSHDELSAVVEVAVRYGLLKLEGLLRVRLTASSRTFCSRMAWKLALMTLRRLSLTVF
jgi:hypothetical protein